MTAHIDGGIQLASHTAARRLPASTTGPSGQNGGSHPVAVRGRKSPIGDRSKVEDTGNPAPHPQRRGNVVIGSMIAIVGVALSIAGMFASTRYAMATASDADRYLFASVAIGADLLTLTLPTGALAIWRARRRGLSLAAMLLWAAAVAVTTANLAGYLGGRLDGFIAGRQSETIERSMTLDRLNRLRIERKAISESRSTGEITIAIRNASAKKIDDERMALQQARRRDQIDSDLIALEQTIGNLPTTVSDDPSAAGISGVANLLTGGQVVIAADLLRKLRLTVLLLLPLVAGLIFAIGTRRTVQL